MSAPEISPELVERMVALVRGVEAVHEMAVPNWFPSLWDEAHRIVAELPTPIDPDMIAAREVVCGYHHDRHPESPWHIEQAEIVRAGRNDQMLDVQAAYHGIKRGRELATIDQGEG